MSSAYAMWEARMGSPVLVHAALEQVPSSGISHLVVSLPRMWSTVMVNIAGLSGPLVGLRDPVISLLIWWVLVARCFKPSNEAMVWVMILWSPP